MMIELEYLEAGTCSPACLPKPMGLFCRGFTPCPKEMEQMMSIKGHFLISTTDEGPLTKLADWVRFMFNKGSFSIKECRLAAKTQTSPFFEDPHPKEKRVGAAGCKRAVPELWVSKFADIKKEPFGATDSGSQRLPASLAGK